MTIAKQAFYEGAALYLMTRSGEITNVQYVTPFFLLNRRLLVLLKYSTKARSPWGFTFWPEEQALLRGKSARNSIVLGLICGADGVAALPYDSYLAIAPPRKSTIHVSCYRQHGEHYEISGPDGTLPRKIPPSTWGRLLSS